MVAAFSGKCSKPLRRWRFLIRPAIVPGLYGAVGFGADGTASPFSLPTGVAALQSVARLARRSFAFRGNRNV